MTRADADVLYVVSAAEYESAREWAEGRGIEVLKPGMMTLGKRYSRAYVAPGYDDMGSVAYRAMAHDWFSSEVMARLRAGGVMGFAATREDIR